MPGFKPGAFSLWTAISTAAQLNIAGGSGMGGIHGSELLWDAEELKSMHSA